MVYPHRWFNLYWMIRSHLDRQPPHLFAWGSSDLLHRVRWCHDIYLATVELALPFPPWQLYLSVCYIFGAGYRANQGSIPAKRKHKLNLAQLLLDSNMMSSSHGAAPTQPLWTPNLDLLPGQCGHASTAWLISLTLKAALLQLLWWDKLHLYQSFRTWSLVTSGNSNCSPAQLQHE